MPEALLIAAQNTGACPGFASRVTAGQNARVLPGQPNNVRTNPATSARRIGQIPAGQTLRVLDGPVCADGYTWWRVSYRDLTGWTAEGSSSEHWLEQSSSSTASSNGIANPTSTRNLLAAIAFDAGGGGGDEICDYAPDIASYSIIALRRTFDDANFQTAGIAGTILLQNNASYTVSYLLKPWEAANSPYTFVSVSVCSPSRARSAYAVSPSGETVAADETRDMLAYAGYQYSLPFTAFARSGRWTLVVDNTQIHINISLTAPGLIQDRDDRHVLISGFRPNEQVVLFRHNRDLLAQAIHIQTDNSGSFYGDLSLGGTWRPFFVALVGDHRSVASDSISTSVCSVSTAELADKLYRAVWLGDSTSVNCTNQI